MSLLNWHQKHWKHSFQNSTWCKCIWVASFERTPSQSTALHIYSSFWGKKVFLFTQLHQILLYLTTDTVNVMYDKGRESVFGGVCMFGLFPSFGYRLEWTGLVSGLIRGSRLYPSLITLLQANIPFVFALFPLIASFLVFFLAGLGGGSAFNQLSVSAVLHLLVYAFFLSTSFSMQLYLKSLWQQIGNSSRDKHPLKTVKFWEVLLCVCVCVQTMTMLGYE